MIYPKFFIVGAQKSGTTTLHDILSKHPEIGLPKYKETKFFLDDKRYNKGINYYINHFFSKQSEKLIYGEIDPEYLYFKQVPERICSTCGENIKIVILLRNPIKRAYSHYRMIKGWGIEKLSFIDAIKEENNKLKMGLYEKTVFSYIDRGLYSQQIMRYFSFFKRENILIYIFEKDIVNNIQETVKEILNFIGARSDMNLDYNIKSNKSYTTIVSFISKYIRRKNKNYSLLRYIIPNKTLRTYLSIKLDKLNRLTTQRKEVELDENTIKYIYINYYKNEIESLEKLLGINLDIWKPL